MHGQGYSEDEEGLEFADLAAARNGAIAWLRDALAGDLLSGVINLSTYIEIEDADHLHVDTLHFVDAVRVDTQIPRLRRKRV